jgi:hypothetical protein
MMIGFSLASAVGEGRKLWSASQNFECNRVNTIRVRVPNEDDSLLAERVTARRAFTIHNQHTYLLPLIKFTQDAARGNDDDN